MNSNQFPNPRRRCLATADSSQNSLTQFICQSNKLMYKTLQTNKFANLTSSVLNKCVVKFNFLNNYKILYDF